MQARALGEAVVALQEADDVGHGAGHVVAEHHGAGDVEIVVALRRRQRGGERLAHDDRAESAERLAEGVGLRLEHQEEGQGRVGREPLDLVRREPGVGQPFGDRRDPSGLVLREAPLKQARLRLGRSGDQRSNRAQPAARTALCTARVAGTLRPNGPRLSERTVGMHS